MASNILYGFEKWLNSVTDEELLASLQEVDADLLLAQEEVDMELHSKEYKSSAPAPRIINVAPPFEYSKSFSSFLIEAA